MIKNILIMAAVFVNIINCGCMTVGGAEVGEKQFTSFIYILQADKFADSKADAVEKLRNSNRQLVVIDTAFDGSESSRWTPEDIKKIRSGMPGRKVVAYFSIGEAETYRSYWEKEWDKDNNGVPDSGAPAFLCSVNPDWSGNYKVKYWNDQWRKIVLKDLRAIIGQGFDGVYLDIVDAFEFFEEQDGEFIDYRVNLETGRSFRRDMIALVCMIAETGRRQSSGHFIVIPQNGIQLVEKREFVEAITCAGVEDLFTNGNKRNPRSEYSYRLNFIKKLRKAGKQTILIEYPKKKRSIAYAVGKAKKYKLLLLITNRSLTEKGRIY